jgi:hypothetical protein
MSNSIRVFRAFAQRTASIAATAATANVRLIPDGAQLTQRGEFNIQVYNNGTAVIFVSFGTDSTLVATTPSGATYGSIPIAPGATIGYRVPGNTTYVAAITGTNGTVYFTPGEGA